MCPTVDVPAAHFSSWRTHPQIYLPFTFRLPASWPRPAAARLQRRFISSAPLMSCLLSICEGLLSLLHCATVQRRKRLSLITRVKAPPRLCRWQDCLLAAEMISKKRRERENKYEGSRESRGEKLGEGVGEVRGCELLRQLLERRGGVARSVWHIDHAGVSTSCLKIRLNERLEDMGWRGVQEN